MRKPSIDQIESVIALASYGSTVEAARILNRSQSQVSSHTAEFERSLGVIMFQRRNGRMFLLDSREDILIAARNTLAAHRALSNLGQQAEKVSSFRIAAPRSLSMSILPKAVARMAKHSPDTKFITTFLSYEEIVTAVATAKADIGVAKLPVLDSRVKVHPLCISPSVVVMKTGDPLEVRNTIHPKDISNRPIVRLGSGMAYWEKIELAFQDQKVTPNFAFEIGGVGPACRLVSEGVGIAIVNELLATEYLGLLGLSARPFKPDVNHEFVRVARELDTKSNSTKVFSDILDATISDHFPDNTLKKK